MQRLKWEIAAVGLLGFIGNLHPSPLGGQGGPLSVQEFREVHLGMEVRFLIDTSGRGDASRMARVAFDRIDSLSLILSDWLPRSELSQVSRLPPGVWHPISEELFSVLGPALEIARTTHGRFDPTVGPLTKLWRQQRATGRTPTPEERDAARAHVGWQHVALDTAARAIRFDLPEMQLDLGGIAKGWILGEVAALLRTYGERRFLLEAGGDLLLGDPPAGTAGWRIRIHHEKGDTTLSVDNIAISTSGPAAQSLSTPGGGIASHVIDLTTGRGSASTLEVTVMGCQTAITDAGSTALTLLPPEEWETFLARYRLTLIAPRFSALPHRCDPAHPPR